VPVAASQDTPGPHARCVADAAELFACMSGSDIDAGRLDPGALKGRRIGVLGEPFMGYSEHSDQVFGDALIALREAGAEIIEDVKVPALKELRKSEAELTILLHEFKAGLNSYLQTRTGVAVRSLQEVIEFNLEHAKEEMPYFRQELLERAQATTDLEAEEYKAAVVTALRLARDAGIDAAVAEHNLDALAAPSGAPAWVVDRISGDRFLGGSSQPAAVAGYPHITVPAGLALGALPVGLSLFGRPERQLDLLAMAYAFEQMIQGRQTPRYLKTLELP
jgi:amidase